MAPDPAPHLIWNVDEMPTDLRSPILIAAFEGWNDAGEASSTAARYVRDHFEAEHVATIDAEDFFDFTVARPNVCIDDNDTRQIVWPSTGIHVARVPGSAHDLVCAIGHEPQLRWRTFVDHLAITAEAFGASMVCTLGALLTDVPHTRPTQVYGGTDDFSYNVVKDPVHIRDLNATVLHNLGIDHERFSIKHQGLDVRLTGVEKAHIIKPILA